MTPGGYLPGVASDSEILAELEYLIAYGRPAWHRQAACRGQGCGPWFPGKGDNPRVARETCARCPVARECAEAGRGEPDGYWGGLSARARRGTAA